MGAGASVFKKKGATPVAEAKGEAGGPKGEAAVAAETKAGSGNAAGTTDAGEKVGRLAVTFTVWSCFYVDA